jgi:hypothetical protein
MCNSKKRYGCKWTWETVQHYTETQIQGKEQHFYCCSELQSQYELNNKHADRGLWAGKWKINKKAI